jgi:hypothetical protein
MSYSVALDNSGIITPYRTTFGVRGIPHAFVIDKNGIVTWSGHPMEPAFESALATAAAATVTPPAPVSRFLQHID